MATKIKQIVPIRISTITAACGGTAKRWITKWVDDNGILTDNAIKKLNSRLAHPECREYLAQWLPLVAHGGRDNIRGMDVVCETKAAGGFTTDAQAPYDESIMPGSQASKAGAAFTIAQFVINNFIELIDDSEPAPPTKKPSKKKAPARRRPTKG